MFPRLGDPSSPRRRWLARLSLLALALVVAAQLWGAVPRDTEVELLLGDDHRAVVALRVAYVQQGEEIHGVRFGFPAGAPDRVRHRVSLPPGDFEVRLELTRKDGDTQQLVRPLRTPAEGTVRYRLLQETS